MNTNSFFFCYTTNSIWLDLKTISTCLSKKTYLIQTYNQILKALLKIISTQNNEEISMLLHVTYTIFVICMETLYTKKQDSFFFQEYLQR